MAEIKSFVLHDESKNTKGFKMRTSGANLDEFTKNPVMLLMHNDWDMPIGRWENIRVEGTEILGDPVFDEEDKKGLEVKGKVDRDFVRMASIGCWPPEAIEYEPDPDRLGETIAVVTKWTVREASIVTIGSNHNAMYFYDRLTGKPVEIKDRAELIKLMDVNPKNQIKTNMDELAQILNLADTATPVERAAAVKEIIAERDRLKLANEGLTVKLGDIETAAANEKKAEAITLVDTAIKDGRIDAKAKDNFIKLFDADFESAKATIEAIPQRKSIQSQIELGDKDAIELADLTAKSWDEIDASGKQAALKKYPELYEQKFEEKFKTKPSKK